MSEIWHVISVKKTQMLLHRLIDVGQLLHEVNRLLYEAGQLLNEFGQQIFAESHQGVWQAGHKSRPPVGKYKNLLIFHPYNRL